MLQFLSKVEEEEIVFDDSIDASIGLLVTLQILQNYKHSGILKARVHHVPDVLGHCLAYIHVDDGDISSCYIEDSRGSRRSIYPDILCYIDDEHGPFEWTFQIQTSKNSTPPVTKMKASLRQTQSSDPQQFHNITALSSTPLTHPQPHTTPDKAATIPCMTHKYLDWKLLSHWTLRHKQLLYAVLVAIDGKRTLSEIKAIVPLPSPIVDEALQILITMRVVTISTL